MLETPSLGRTACADMPKPFFETSKSRGERSLVCGFAALAVLVARAVSHAFDTRKSKESRTLPVVPKPRGPY